MSGTDEYRFPELDLPDRLHLQTLYNLHGRDRVRGWLRSKVAVPFEYRYDNDDFDEDAYWDAAVDHYVDTDAND